MSAWTDNGFPHNLRFANPRDVYNTLAAAAEERARVFNWYTFRDFDRLNGMLSGDRYYLEEYIRRVAGNYVHCGGPAPAYNQSWPRWTAAALEQQYGIPAAPQRLEHKLDVRWALRMYKILNCCTTLEYHTDSGRSALYASGNPAIPPSETMDAALSGAIAKGEQIVPTDNPNNWPYTFFDGAEAVFGKSDYYDFETFMVHCNRRQWLTFGPGPVRSNTFGFFPSDIAADATLFLYASRKRDYYSSGKVIDYFDPGIYGFVEDSWNEWGTLPVVQGEVGAFETIYPEFAVPPVAPEINGRVIIGFNIGPKSLLVNCAVEGGFDYYDPPEVWLDL